MGPPGTNVGCSITDSIQSGLMNPIQTTERELKHGKGVGGGNTSDGLASRLMFSPYVYEQLVYQELIL